MGNTCYTVIEVQLQQDIIYRIYKQTIAELKRP